MRKLLARCGGPRPGEDCGPVMPLLELLQRIVTEAPQRHEALIAQLETQR